MDVPGLPMTPLMSAMPDATTLAGQNRANHQRATAEVAHGFESLFASLLVKEMRQTLDQDTMFGQDHGEVLGGLFDFYMGQHLADAGKLGVGAMINKQMNRDKTNDAPNHQTLTAARNALGSAVSGAGR